MPLPSHPAGAPPFVEHIRTALHDLRAALLDVMAEAGADPMRPQDVARDFGLNKNLTWKISKIAGSDDLLAAVPHVPGRSGMEIFLAAMERAGAGDAAVTQASDSARRYEDVVNLHTDDRSTLEIMVDGALPAPQQTEQIRKLAFQGNSAIWGVRARAQMTFKILMPNQEDAGFADLVQIGGLVGFRRLHANRRWLLLRRETWSDDEEPNDREVTEPLDPAIPPGGVPLLTPYCSTPLPEVHVISTPGEVQVELPPGPVGNTAALTCVYAELCRCVGEVSAATEGEYNELGAAVITPAEHLIMDLMVHRDFDWAMAPELVVHGRLDGAGLHTTQRRDRNILNVPEEPLDLGRGLGGLATPIIPQQQRMAAWVFDRIGRDPDEFRAFRVSMPYPPMPIVALLRSPLPLRG